MNKALRFLARLFSGKTRIGRQMQLVYALALLIPLAVIGFLLLFSARNILTDHYLELLQADNRRVRTVLTEITTHAYDVSARVGSDSALKALLVKNYESSKEFVSAANSYTQLDSLIYSSEEITSITVYTDNPTVKTYKQFQQVDGSVFGTVWYQRAVNQPSAFWTSLPDDSTFSNNNLCLVQRIRLPESGYNAVAVITVSDRYIRSRIDSGVIDAVTVDDQVVYSSRHSWYGRKPLMEIPENDGYFSYSGTLTVDDTRYFSNISATTLHMTSSRMYIYTLDNSGFSDIYRIVLTCVLLLAVSLLVPGIILSVFSASFSGRVLLLRKEMHKAATQDYDILTEFKGRDELAEAFQDLKNMVQAIKAKDARMYEAELKEQALLNKQQSMEFKMLASQINPHYLYNTLETIRMKALTSGNREVADCIKLLGKTLHYVLENTGTTVTTLQKELDHVVNYLSIQKLRFGERINYRITLEPGLDPASYPILPLLLQPVVENAVVHGLETLNGSGFVEIRAFVTEDGLLSISIRDNGNGIEPQELDRIRLTLDTPQMPHSSIALYNIHQRIRLYYGDDYGVCLESQPGQGTQVTLVLPQSFPKRS